MVNGSGRWREICKRDGRLSGRVKEKGRERKMDKEKERGQER